MQVGTYDIEQLWLLDWQQDRESAFGHVYQQFHQRLYFFALRFVEDADAKDVVSEAFVQLWQKRVDFTSTSAIARFLFLTVRNRCLNVVRHLVVQQQHRGDILYLLEQSDETDLYQEQLTGELMKLIYSEVDKLPARMKEIFLLSFAEGLKPADIARRLELSVQTVSNQKLSAIQLLRAALGSRAVFLSLLLLLETAREPVAPLV